MNLDDKIGWRERLNNWAYRKAWKHSPSLADMLVSDVRMPKLSGYSGISLTEKAALAFAAPVLGYVCLVMPGCGGGGGGDSDGGNGGSTNKAPYVVSSIAPVSIPEDSSTETNVAGNFADPDGDSLTYSVSGFTDVVAVLAGDNINISAPQDYNGTETGSVKACDPDKACATTPLEVTFEPVNDAPNIDGVTMYLSLEGSVLDGVVNTSDVDGDAVTCSLVDNGGLTELEINTDCTITSSAPLGYASAGTYTANIDAFDGTATTNSDITISVADVNRKPVVNDIAINMAEELKALDGYVQRTDLDGDPTTCELVNSDVTEARVNADGTVYSCTNTEPPCGPLAPDPLPIGTGGNNKTLEVRCTDGFEVSDNFVKVFDIEGYPVSSTIPEQVASEDSSVVLNAGTYFTDPNLDALTFSVQGFANISGLVSGSDITFSAPLNYNGSETGKVKACDPTNLCKTENVTVTFTPVNDPPSVDGVTMYSSIEGSFLDGVVDVSDVDGDAVTCSLGANGGLTELVINPDCTITSSSALPYDRQGTYFPTVNANDGTVTNPGVVQIDVADNDPLNNPPVVDVPFAPVSTPEESITSVSVLGHFSDLDLDLLTYSVSGFTDITAVLSGTDIDISAPLNYNGTETGLVQACDPEPACVSTPLEITYTGVNDLPEILGLVMNISQEGSFLDGFIDVNDVDGDPVTCHLSSHGGLAELVVNLDCTIASTVPLPYDSAGSYNIVVWAEDPYAGTPNATLPLDVANTNRAPTITDVVFDFAEEGAYLNGGIYGNDPDSDPVTCYFVSSDLPEAKVSPGCGIYSDVKLPSAAEVLYNIVVGMTDGTLDDTFSKDFEVQRPPSTPYATCDGSPCGPDFGVSEDPWFPLEFTLNSTDPNSDPVTYQSSTLPTGASLNPNTGLFSWSPDCTQSGAYSPSFQAKDNHGALSEIYSVIITVNETCSP